MTGLWMLAVFLVSYIGGALSQTGDDAKNLRKTLFVTNDYDKKIRPREFQHHGITVFVSYYLLGINGLYEVTETLTTTGFLVIGWFDDFLVWEPNDYGGIDFATWPQDDVWKPDVTLRNSVLDYKELGSSGLNVEADHRGLIHWYPFQIFQSACDVDIPYFPFDKQTCHLTFVAWSYTKYFVELTNGSMGVDLDDYQENPMWEIVDTSHLIDDATSDSSIRFTIVMKRKPMHFILSILMPIVLLGLLNVCAFALPCESGERAGYTMTVFLALAVFLTIIAASLPANSETTSIFSVYVIIQTVQSVIITIIALITIRLSSKETKVPGCLAAFTRCVNCMRCGSGRNRTKSTKRSYSGGSINKGNDMSIYDLEHHHRQRRIFKNDGPYSQRRIFKNDGPYSQRMSFRDDEPYPRRDDESYYRRDDETYYRRDDEPYPQKEEKDDDRNEDAVNWSLAVRAIDFICFLFFFTIFAVSTVVCILISVEST